MSRPEYMQEFDTLKQINAYKNAKWPYINAELKIIYRR